MSVHHGCVVFSRARTKAIVWELPVSSVVSVSVQETIAPWWQRSEARLAIVFAIATSDGARMLPVVPTSDDGRRLLTWSEGEVRELAWRLRDAIAAQTAG